MEVLRTSFSLAKRPLPESEGRGCQTAGLLLGRNATWGPLAGLAESAEVALRALSSLASGDSDRLGAELPRILHIGSFGLCQ